MERDVLNRAAILVYFCSCTLDTSGPARFGPAPSQLPFAAPAAGAGVQFRQGVVIPAGEEATICKFVELSADSVYVRKWRSRTSTGSEHLLLYTTSLAQAPRDDLFDCTNQGDWGLTGVLYAASEPTAQLTWPAGVGMRFEAGAVLLYQARYLNPTDADLNIEALINAYFAAEEEPIEHEAGSLFFNNWGIFVPGGVGSQGDATMRCPITRDIELVMVGSRMNQRGVHFRASVVGQEAFFDHSDGASPAPLITTPAPVLRRGDELEFSCQYVNDREQPMLAGTSATDSEVCTFVAGYYPKLPSPADDYCLRGGPVFKGQRTCGEAIDCLDGPSTLEALLGCLSGTCESSSKSLSDFIACLQDSDCEDASCASSSCATELLACQASGC